MERDNTTLAKNNIGISDSRTLLFDNAVFAQKSNRMLQCENELVFDTTAFNFENEVCGTESMCIIADYWHNIEKMGQNFRAFLCEDIDHLLSETKMSINQVDEESASLLNIGNDNSNKAELTYMYDNDGAKSGPFDDEGRYGGSQLGPIEGKVFFKWVFFEDKKLYAFIKKHPGYENYSEIEIYNLLKKIEEHGCSFVANTNVIFNSYIGREEEFEKTFGFPMYAQNGDLNYDMLLVDYYIKTQDKVFLDCEESGKAYIGTFLNYYDDHPDEFYAKYGESFRDRNGDISENARQYAFDEYDKLINSGETVAEFNDAGGAHPNTKANKMDYYCKEHGINMDCIPISETPNCSDIDFYLSNGYTVLFSSSEFTLENEDGSKYSSGHVYGGHAMTITGTTEDGRYIVSTWGIKLYFDPNDNNADMNTYGFYAMKVD
ncbi:MAG: hypothetical protein VZR06_04530 [Butyrivibrio sp.]|nr:hypothetical protein [Butyrivibrio sp.]